MSECEQSRILDELFPVDLSQELCRDMSGSRLRHLYGRRGLWVSSLFNVYGCCKFLLCESRSACEDVVCQNMFAKVFRRFGMIFARTGITLPYQVLNTPVRLGSNFSLTIGSNGHITAQNKLYGFLSASIEFRYGSACFVRHNLHTLPKNTTHRRLRKGLTIEDVLPTGFNDCYHCMNS